MFHARGPVVTFYDQMGLLKSLLHIAFADLIMGQDITLLMNPRSIRFQGLAGIGDHGEGIIIYLDKGEGFLSYLLRFGGHYGYRISPKAHFILAEDGLIGNHVAEKVAARHILSGKYSSHSFQLSGPTNINFLDQGVRIAGAQGFSIKHALQVEVLGIAGLPGDLVQAVDSSDTFAHDFHGRILSSFYHCYTFDLNQSPFGQTGYLNAGASRGLPIEIGGIDLIDFGKIIHIG
ncbi:MAG: hypothetical protein DDT18_01539 [Actinobacteria bacterium]|nr:hypothetical protein [Actinomycetota bacterium]